MLFNSYEFLFVFLPIAVFGFFGIGRVSHHLAALWLGTASLFFYGWWNPTYVLLLLASIIGNYGVGYALGHAPAAKRKILLTAGVAANLSLLAYFKYANFFVNTLNQAADTHWNLGTIILPLGISFFTFTQIAFLVDVHRGVAREYRFVHYLLFVTYFPHLIAGPVLHHKQMMPQFGNPSIYRPNPRYASVGLSIFVIGLAKKVFLADRFAGFANPVFDIAAEGGRLATGEAWIGAVSYTLQLYFDFSGYSDMAIGLSLLFGIRLPINFNSPYKSRNIIEFWRRWHMTLSAFLRDYLYIPLGGNRNGPLWRHVNLLVTMLLGGLWHGAGWNFVLWGGIHGVYLVINHVWQGMAGRGRVGSRVGTILSVLLTFALVVVAWVPFRANGLDASFAILRAMAGVPGEIANSLVDPLKINLRVASLWLVAGLAIVWFMPNTQQIFARQRPVVDRVSPVPRLRWKPTAVVSVAMGFLFAACVLSFKKNSPFLYFQF